MKRMIKTVKKLWKQITDQFWRAKCNYIKYVDALSIDENMILLESEHGKKLDGNIFYLIKYLAKEPLYSNFKIYVSSMGRYKKKFTMFLQKHQIDNVTVVMTASDEYMRILASAKFLINDTSFGTYFIKKEGQIYLNTWHGTPLKTLGRSDKAGYYSLANVQKNFAVSDFLLYPNEYTRDHMLEDYMLRNISRGKYILAGYPRNEIFFDEERRDVVKTELGLSGKRVYAYLPTYRGSFKDGKNPRNTAYLSYYLYEIDANLRDDEELYVNLHPLAQKDIDFRSFKHIHVFPNEYEIYEFLNTADVLITDYSSVFFDYAVTQKKVILFPYDEADYTASRGMYMPLESLPFPKVYDVSELLREMRSGKQYDETAFLKEFCPYESGNASKKLCDAIISGVCGDMIVRSIPSNRKENVFLYTGNLSANGITASVRSLLNTIDLTERNYYLTFSQEHIKKNKCNILSFPEGVSYYATTGDLNLTILDRVVRKLFKKKVLSADIYMKLNGKRVQQDFERCFGNLNLDAVIQFNGYEQEVILKFSTFSGRKAIFVHNDMKQEIETRHNQRLDVLRYAYRNYDRVAVVSEDILNSTYWISGRRDNLHIVRNTIDYKSVLLRSTEEIALDSHTKVFPDREAFFNVICSENKKFISVGRFSPEKGHERLVNAYHDYVHHSKDDRLIIMGGNSLGQCYEKLISQIKALGLEDRVVLLLNVSNPYPIIKACDYFVLSSYYEGFGLVLAEADILGKPVISTDIDGPRGFMKQYGGTLVKDSQDGIREGFDLLRKGAVKPMLVDYERYNQEVIQEFEQIFT